jgi:hypothetical protein
MASQETFLRSLSKAIKATIAVQDKLADPTTAVFLEKDLHKKFGKEWDKITATMEKATALFLDKLKSNQN